MNVFGKNERSWRKARKRGVSPIIATILLVAITVVLAAVLYVLISGLTGGGVGSKPIGTAFNAGAPVSSVCPAGKAYATFGCLAGDYIYTLTVESSTVTLSNVQFEVKTAAGAILTAASVGGFSIESISGAIAAQSPASTTMAMTAAFSTFGASPICNGAACGTSTPLTTIYTIVIDMGTGNPTGLGYTFVTIGIGGFTGTTTPLSLP